MIVIFSSCVSTGRPLNILEIDVTMCIVSSAQ